MQKKEKKGNYLIFLLNFIQTTQTTIYTKIFLPFFAFLRIITVHRQKSRKREKGQKELKMHNNTMKMLFLESNHSGVLSGPAPPPTH
jgi:hypothetical protein